MKMFDVAYTSFVSPPARLLNAFPKGFAQSVAYSFAAAAIEFAISFLFNGKVCFTMLQIVDTVLSSVVCYGYTFCTFCAW